MSTITGISPNAITPVTHKPHNDGASPNNNAHEQFARTTFTPVEANQQNDASKSSTNQRPEQDISRQNQQDIQNKHNQSNSSKEAKEAQASEQEENTNNKQQADRQLQAQMKEEQQIVSQLKTRDAEVRAHEMAHKTVGGKYAGGIQYEYTKGPDGNKYVVGGEVPISISELNDPEMTAQKMQQVREAALAPVEPSAQDRSVAAKATQIEMKAYADIAKMERVEEQAKMAEKEEYKKESDDMSKSTEDTQSSDNDAPSSDQSSSDHISIEDFNTAPSDVNPIQSSSSQATGLNLNVIA